MNYTLLIVINAIAVAGLSTACIILNKQFPQFALENGPMENFQAVCLVAGSLLCLWRAWVVRSLAQRIFISRLALFFISFLVLEVDTRKLKIHALDLIFNGSIRDIWLGGLWSIALYSFIRNRNVVWDAFRLWVPTPSGMTMIFAGGFWLLSAAVDKSILFTKSLFTEETLEVSACFLMTESVALLWKSSPRIAEHSTLRSKKAPAPAEQL